MSKRDFMSTTGMTIRQKLDKEIATVVDNSKHKRASLSYNIKHITFSDFLSDKLLIMNVIRGGVPYSLFDLIQSSAPFSDDDWTSFLNISAKSLQRYKQSSKSFKPIHSEKIIELAEVTDLGLNVFGKMEKFKLWLATPNFSLGNFQPIELLKDSYGKEMVMSELTRINHGILV